jgi:hypothetical protein
MLVENNKNFAPQARPPRATGAHEAYIGPDGSIHCVNEACMYVPNVECTGVVHVVMLSLKSAGEGADSKFVPRRGVRSRALARRAGQTRELTSGFRARNPQHKVSHMRVHMPANARACLRHSRAHGQMCKAREVVPSHALMCRYMCVCLFNRNTAMRCADKH